MASPALLLSEQAKGTQFGTKVQVKIKYTFSNFGRWVLLEIMALEIIGGALFTLLYDGVKQAMSKSGTFKSLLRDLNSTLEALVDIQQIGELNVELGLPNEEIEGLKMLMEEGVKLVEKLSNLHMWNYCCLNDYTEQIAELNRALKRLLQKLEFQESRDVKELMLLARQVRDTFDELKRRQLDIGKSLPERAGDVMESSVLGGNAETVREQSQGNVEQPGVEDLIEGIMDRGRRANQVLVNKNSKIYMDLKDIVRDHALPYLPAKSLFRFTGVCRDWKLVILTHFFAHKQSNCFSDISGFFYQSRADPPSFISLDRNAYGVPDPCLKFLPEPVDIRTSSNGLLCCQGRDGYNYICNPVTNKWKKLPKANTYHGPVSFLALALEPSVLDFEAKFELVCAFSVRGHTGVYFDIFSSRSNSWELSDAVCYELNALELSGNGIFLKGVVFWETSTGHILAFDLKEKQYGMMLLPLGSGPQGVMTEMNGELCYILPCEDDDGQYTLEIYGDMCMNLKRRIHLVGEVFNHVTEGLRALACVNDDVVVILLGGYLIAYHVKAGEIETLRTCRINAGYERFLPYVNSLVAI